VVGAAILLPDFNDPGVMDSKMFDESKREACHDIMIERLFDHAVGEASEYEIDIYGLSQAKRIATKRAIYNLKNKPEYILFDGYALKKFSGYPFRSIIKGDQKVKSIASASIVAKVFRDRKIKKLSNQYPQYNFEDNKGYGTKKHQAALKTHGVCPIHRKSYQPIKKILNKK
jgi:ribonuclease HII